MEEETYDWVTEARFNEPRYGQVWEDTLADIARALGYPGQGAYLRACRNMPHEVEKRLDALSGTASKDA